MGRKRFEALSTTGSELLFPTRVRWYSFIRQVMELPRSASWIMTMAVNRTDGGAPPLRSKCRHKETSATDKLT